MVSTLNDQPGLSVVGEAEDGNVVLDQVRKSQPDVLLLDVSLPGKSGLDVAKEMSLAHLGIPIVMLTMHRESGIVSEAFASGVQGYVLKEDSDQEVFDAIHAVCTGGRHVSSLLNT